MPRGRSTDVRAAVLDYAQKLFQQRGYNAVSYYDLAATVGVTTATIHYYFPSKGDLAVALLLRYSEQIQAQLDRIAVDEPDLPRRLDRLLELFISTYADERRICLGGMFATDLLSLPPAAQELLRNFFAAVETWLARQLSERAAADGLRLGGTPAQVAQSVIALLEGALLIARAFDDVGRLHTLRHSLRALVGAPTPITEKEHPL